MPSSPYEPAAAPLRGRSPQAGQCSWCQPWTSDIQRAHRLAIATRLAGSTKPTRDFVSAWSWRGICLLLSKYGVHEIDHQWRGARSEGLAGHATALGLAR